MFILWSAGNCSAVLTVSRMLPETLADTLDSQRHEACPTPGGGVAASVLVQAHVQGLIRAHKAEALSRDHKLSGAHGDVVEVLGQQAQQLAPIAAPAGTSRTLMPPGKLGFVLRADSAAAHVHQSCVHQDIATAFGEQAQQLLPHCCTCRDWQQWVPLTSSAEAAPGWPADVCRLSTILSLHGPAHAHQGCVLPCPVLCCVCMGCSAAFPCCCTCTSQKGGSIGGCGLVVGRHPTNWQRRA